MLSVKLKADDVKLIRKAMSGFDEYSNHGSKALETVLTRIEEAETLKEISRGKKAQEYTWKDAQAALQSVLGDLLRIPPAPDGVWYTRINQTIARHGLNDAYLIALGEHARKHLKPPYSFDFLIGQHLQIMGGKYDQVKPRVATRAARAYIEPRLE